ncbi:MAG: hypothetical protein GX143_00475 [Alcaligenaceae bacterium]|jgi:predicted HTH transcriptional regulator|nr:hypothetical protein [Alcaligenaceae bacterium]
MTSSILSLLQQPESKILEFKRDLSSPQPLLKSLIAFANSAGGRLIIGVNDEHKIIGVTDPLAEEERICNLIADNIAPRLVPNVELTSLNNKTLLIVEVFPSSSRPHYFKKQGPEQGVYVRLGSTNRQADPALIAELQRGVLGISFDEIPMPQLSIQELDLETAEKLFGNKRTLDEKSLLTLKLLCKEQGRLVPTQGAILLFGKDREMYFPDAWVQCGRFRGTNKAHCVRIVVTLPFQLKQAVKDTHHGPLFP